MNLKLNLTAVDAEVVPRVCYITIRVGVTGKVSFQRIYSWANLFRPGGLLHRGEAPTTAQIMQLYHDRLANLSPSETINSEEKWRSIRGKRQTGHRVLDRGESGCGQGLLGHPRSTYRGEVSGGAVW